MSEKKKIEASIYGEGAFNNHSEPGIILALDNGEQLSDYIKKAQQKIAELDGILTAIQKFQPMYRQK